MKKTLLLLVLLVSFLACDSDDNATTAIAESNVSFNFTQSFDGEAITIDQFNDISFTNENGEQLSINRLRYLITDIVLTDGNGIDTVVSDFNFVDVGASSGATLDALTRFNEGDYTLSMRFGFSDEDNIDGAYPDLNAASWSVPGPLGGGYHYMQLEGMYINDESVTTNYQYHTISAVQNPGENPEVTNTSIAIDLGTITIEGTTTIIEVDMNIAEWFKNPNTWDLNELFTVLMPNFDAQIMMNQNGQNVFSLGTVTSIQE